VAGAFARWGSVRWEVAQRAPPEGSLSAFVDTSVLIDYLRGHQEAATVLETHRAAGRLHASEITRLEVLAGMRPNEETATRSLLSAFVWHVVDTEVAERAGMMGRQWLPSHHTIDSADLAIAATAQIAGLELLTTNVRHYPMFTGLRPPY
jgi:predicted nucleic acid-binding protein